MVTVGVRKDGRKVIVVTPEQARDLLIERLARKATRGREGEVRSEGECDDEEDLPKAA